MKTPVPTILATIRSVPVQGPNARVFSIGAGIALGQWTESRLDANELRRTARLVAAYGIHDEVDLESHLVGDVSDASQLGDL